MCSGGRSHRRREDAEARGVWVSGLLSSSLVGKIGETGVEVK